MRLHVEGDATRREAERVAREEAGEAERQAKVAAREQHEARQQATSELQQPLI